MKVDFGTQVEGYIIDCAWTVAFDPQFDPLLEAVREATNTGIRNAGIDVPLNEVTSSCARLFEAFTWRVACLRGVRCKISCCTPPVFHVSTSTEHTFSDVFSCARS